MEETQVYPVTCIRKNDPSFPKRLEDLKGMPKQLYIKGQKPKEDKPTIAIIGARLCSSYGSAQARRFGEYFSRAGVQVISGLAQGIDGEAHRGALLGPTATFAVMGNGVDICYPARNRSCYWQILAQDGGILSEYPEGTNPFPSHFPARNRIISALADLILVIEAREKSGSLITVDFALEQGKPVFALPGPVDSPLSLGCHKLIEEGAGIAYSPKQVLNEWNPNILEIEAIEKKNQIPLATQWNLVYSCLDLQPKNVEFLVSSLHLPVQSVMQILMELELRGLIREVGKNYYVRL